MGFRLYIVWFYYIKIRKIELKLYVWKRFAYPLVAIFDFHQMVQNLANLTEIRGMVPSTKDTYVATNQHFCETRIF